MWRCLPLAGMLLIVLITVCVRPWLQFRRHGTLGILLFQSGRRAQNLRDAALVILIAMLVVQAAAAAVGPHERNLLIAGIVRDVVQAVGAALMVGGIVVLATAQLNLGASWRIGIKESESPGLVTGGLYRFCRHPIYLGLLTALTGYAALLPTPLSLALLAAAYVGVRAQVAAEEAHLRRTYGDAFCAYARRVGRLLPGIGKAPPAPKPSRP
jgi:protein-S-isoprenylcysteine O-methyltransferase Ste14